MSKQFTERTYIRSESAVFCKTKERFGALSNMAGGFPIILNEVHILSSEALYQACRFPHMPDIQKIIIDQKSPMTAKMKSKPYRKYTRDDWEEVKIKVMRWCLRIKLFENWEKFGYVLSSTGSLPIVEESRKDKYWGAKAIDNYQLIGINALGRLLMELREEFLNLDSDTCTLYPPKIDDFVLLDNKIEAITYRNLIERKATYDITGPQISAQQISIF